MKSALDPFRLTLFVDTKRFPTASQKRKVGKNEDDTDTSILDFLHFFRTREVFVAAIQGYKTAMMVYANAIRAENIGDLALAIEAHLREFYRLGREKGLKVAVRCHVEAHFERNRLSDNNYFDPQAWRDGILSPREVEKSSKARQKQKQAPTETAVITRVSANLRPRKKAK